MGLKSASGALATGVSFQPKEHTGPSSPPKGRGDSFAIEGGGGLLLAQLE